MDEDTKGTVADNLDRDFMAEGDLVYFVLYRTCIGIDEDNGQHGRLARGPVRLALIGGLGPATRGTARERRAVRPVAGGPALVLVG